MQDELVVQLLRDDPLRSAGADRAASLDGANFAAGTTDDDRYPASQMRACIVTVVSVGAVAFASLFYHFFSL